MKLKYWIDKSKALTSTLMVWFCLTGFAGSGTVNNDGTIDITLNLRFPPSAADLQTIQDQVTDASEVLWDASEGQLRFGDVTLTCGSVDEDLADMWVFAEAGRAGVSFRTDGSNLSARGVHVNQYLPSSTGIVLAHEFGHLALGLGDEYDEQSRFGNCWGIGSCIEAVNLSEQNQCLMQQPAGFTQTEFCTAAGHDTLLGDGLSCAVQPVPHGCATNCEYWNNATSRYETSQQTYLSTVDCWTHVVNNFGFLAAPAGLPAAAAPGGFTDPNFIDNCEATDTVMLILDRSGSMAWNTDSDDGEICGDGIDNDGDGSVDEADDCTESRLEFAQAAARAWLSLANNQGIRAGVVSFNDAATLDEPFQEVTDANLPRLEAAVDGLASGGGTAIGMALSQTVFTFDAETTALNKTAFLISDGVNTDGPAPETVVDTLQDRGIRVFTISTGAASDDETLTEIAGETDGSQVDASSATTLVNAFAQQWARYRNLGTLIPILPYAVNAESKTEDDYTLLDPNQRTEEMRRRARVWSLGLEEDLIPINPALFPKNNLIQFRTEPDTLSFTLILAGDMGDMNGFGVHARLLGPAGPSQNQFDTNVPAPEMRVVQDRYFTLIEITKPNAGLWGLDLETAQGASAIQTGNMTLLVDTPQTDLFTGLDHYLVDDPTELVRLHMSPIHHTTLHNMEVVEARVIGPDGSEQVLPVQANFEMGLPEDYTAELTNFPVAGLYEVRVLARSGFQTANDPGESIWSTEPVNTVPVPLLERTSTEYFWVRQGLETAYCPPLNMHIEGRVLHLEWTQIDPFTVALLESAPTVNGPWTTITAGITKKGHAHSYQTGMQSKQSFYRLICDSIPDKPTETSACLELKDLPLGMHPNPLQHDDWVIVSHDGKGNLLPTLEQQEIKQIRGLSTGVHLEWTATSFACEQVEVTWVHFSQGGVVRALNMDGAIVDEHKMIAPAGVVESAILTSKDKGIHTIQLITPQQETLLIDICCFGQTAISEPIDPGTPIELGLCADFTMMEPQKIDNSFFRDLMTFNLIDENGRLLPSAIIDSADQNQNGLVVQGGLTVFFDAPCDRITFDWFASNDAILWTAFDDNGTLLTEGKLSGKAGQLVSDVIENTKSPVKQIRFNTSGEPWFLLNICCLAGTEPGENPDPDKPLPTINVKGAQEMAQYEYRRFSYSLPENWNLLEHPVWINVEPASLGEINLGSFDGVEGVYFTVQVYGGLERGAIELISGLDGSVLDEVELTVIPRQQNDAAQAPAWDRHASEFPEVQNAWGSEEDRDAPQNYGDWGIAKSNYRIATIVVELNDGTMTDAAFNQFSGEIDNAFNTQYPDLGVREWFQDASYGKTDIQWFNQRLYRTSVGLNYDNVLNGPNDNNRFNKTGTSLSTVRDVITETLWADAVAANPQLGLLNNFNVATRGDMLFNNYFDCVMIIIPGRPDPDDATQTQFVWPSASSDERVFWHPDFGVRDALTSTIIHELCHAFFNFGDLYGSSFNISQDFKNRDPRDMEMMSGSDDGPDLSVYHKLKIGWVEPKEIAVINPLNFPLNDVQVLSDLRLQSMSRVLNANDIDAGQKRAVEFRIANGYNLYVEYRSRLGDYIPYDDILSRRTSGGVPFDKHFTVFDGRTDREVTYDPDYVARRLYLMLAPFDADTSNNWPPVDGPVLRPGTDDELIIESLHRTPFQELLQITPEDGDERSGKLNVMYVRSNESTLEGVIGPDPSIRPWNRYYQSPDIKIRNARNTPRAQEAGESIEDYQVYLDTIALWKNVPLPNQPNTIIAKVANDTAFDANKVEVLIGLKDYTVNSEGTETLFSPVVRNIPAGTTVEFPLVTRIQARRVDGQPDPDNFHVCVTVRIKDYTTQINGVDYQEITTANNAAQSNYSRFITGESSPANIDRIPMIIKNTLDEPAYASIHTGASHSEYQFFQNEPVFLLKANEERLVHIGVQYEKDRAWGNGYKGYEPGPQARVVFKGRLQPAQSKHELQTREDVTIDIGGAGGIIFGGGKVQFHAISTTKGFISGQVLRKNTERFIPGGLVMAIFETEEPRSAPSTRVDEEGRFSLSLPQGLDKVELHYLPAPGMPYTPHKEIVHIQ